MEGHVRRHHGAAEADESADALEIFINDEERREIERFAADPVIAATMRSITTEEVVGQPRSARRAAVAVEAPLRRSTHRVRRHDLPPRRGKPAAEELDVLLRPAAGRDETKGRKGVVRRGVHRRRQPTTREYGREAIRTRGGEERETTAPRWVTRETYTKYQDGEVVERGESTQYEY